MSASLRLARRMDLPVSRGEFVATISDLDDAVVRSKFREESCFRLSVMSLYVPLFCDRTEYKFRSG